MLEKVGVVSTKVELLPYVHEAMGYMTSHHLPLALEAVDLSDEFGSITAGSIYEALAYFALANEAAVTAAKEPARFQQQQQQRTTLDVLSGVKGIKRLVLVYLDEIQKIVCDAQSAGEVGSASGITGHAAATMLAAWAMKTLEVSQPFAFGIAVAILMVVISAGHSTFCRLTKRTFRVSLEG